MRNWDAGIGFVITRGTKLVVYRAAKAKACSPIQAEAMALKEAAVWIQSKGVESCLFLTDNQTLAKVITSPHPPTDAD